MNEEKELTLEELEAQLKELKEENEALKAKLEAPATEVVLEETPEETEETPEAVEEVPEEAPAPEDDKETALQTRLEALWQREVKAELKEAGLEAFADFINVEVDDSEGLTAKIKSLKALLEDYEVENTFQPTSHTNTADAYSIAKKNRNPREMLKARLG